MPICCISGQSLLGFILGCLSFFAWSLGFFFARYDVFQQPYYYEQPFVADTTTTAAADFGLLGFCPHHDGNSNHYQEQEQHNHNYLKYTINQEDMFVDWYWRIARYLYLVFCVLGLLQTQWVYLSYCGAWPILSKDIKTNRRSLARNSFILALLPIGILFILYSSKLCPQQQQSQENENNPTALVLLEYSTNNAGIKYATTATLKEVIDEEADHDADAGGRTTTCAPTDGAYSLLIAAGIWFFCSIWMNCCCIPDTNSSSNIINNNIKSKKSKKKRNNRLRDASSSSTTNATSLSKEPLLDPATRTLGWIAIVIILTLFTTFPYWENTALIAMSPQVATPFTTTTTKTTDQKTTNSSYHNSNSNGGMLPISTQLIGPNIFNPTQNITYSSEQQEWIDPAFEMANILAWVPFGVHLCLSLPIILYGRYRLATYNKHRNGGGENRSNCCWPNLIMTTLALIEIGMAVLCLFIPYSVAQQLCYDDDNIASSNFPELRYERSEDTSSSGGGGGGGVIWRGADIKYHSTMSTSCWPTEVGQFLCIGGPLLCLVQVGLLIMFGIQYDNAQDTLATFAGGEEDQHSLLLDSGHSRTSDEGGEGGV